MKVTKVKTPPQYFLKNLTIVNQWNSLHMLGTLAGIRLKKSVLLVFFCPYYCYNIVLD